MHVSQQLDLFPEYFVTQCLFTDVENAAELRKGAVGGEIRAAFINASMVVDSFQILVAANKAIHLQKAAKMKTRNLYSEVIFNLSPTNNILESLKKFGISDGDKAVLLVMIHRKEEENCVDEIKAKVSGQCVPLEQISTFTEIAKVKKLYKVTSLEAKCGSLLDAVVCRMAIKDVL